MAGSLQFFRRSFSKLLFIAAFSSLGLGCASSSDTELYAGSTPIHDPFEDYNRAVFAFNTAVDGILIHPIIEGYRFILPKPARTGISNFLSNLKSPVHFANELLQGDLSGAGTVLTRATVNTVIGVGGVFDVAKHEGIDIESEDFGQTMAVWGVGNGPYIVVPFLGPATLRDYAGFFVDAYADPLRIYLHNIDKEGWTYARSGAEYLVLRDSLMDVLKDLERSSVDYYAATRSTYYQRRDAMIRDSKSANGKGANYPDYYDEL